MKIKSILMLLIAGFAVVSCTTDDAASSTADGSGKIDVKFDNIFAGADLFLSNQNYTTSQGENLKVDNVKYIISNIVLTREDGTLYVYPKSKSYFIVSESDKETQTLKLTDVPFGKYTKIQFGIGVDETQYELGASGQGDFLALAQTEDMLWSWSSGYKYLAFEGTFNSATVTTQTSYMVHTGKTGTAYNYTDVSLSMPDKALVRADIVPSIHVLADVSKIIDGNNKIVLSDNNMHGMGAMIMGGDNLELITENLQQMFSIDHVHND